MQLNNNNNFLPTFIDVEISREKPIKQDFGITFGKVHKVTIQVPLIKTFYYDDEKCFGTILYENDVLYIEKEMYKKLRNNLEII